MCAFLIRKNLCLHIENWPAWISCDAILKAVYQCFKLGPVFKINLFFVCFSFARFLLLLAASLSPSPILRSNWLAILHSISSILTIIQVAFNRRVFRLGRQRLFECLLRVWMGGKESRPIVRLSTWPISMCENGCTCPVGGGQFKHVVHLLSCLLIFFFSHHYSLFCFSLTFLSLSLSIKFISLITEHYPAGQLRRGRWRTHNRFTRMMKKKNKMATNLLKINLKPLMPTKWANKRQIWLLLVDQILFVNCLVESDRRRKVDEHFLIN